MALQLPGVPNFSLIPTSTEIARTIQNNQFQAAQTAALRQKMSLADLAEQRLQKQASADMQMRQQQQQMQAFQLAGQVAGAIQQLPEEERAQALQLGVQRLNQTIPGSGDILAQQPLEVLSQAQITPQQRAENLRSERAIDVQEGQLDLAGRRFEQSVMEFGRQQALDEAQFLQRVNEFETTSSLANREFAAKEIDRKERSALLRAESEFKRSQKRSPLGILFEDAAKLEAEGRTNEADILRTASLNEMIQKSDANARKLTEKQFKQESDLRKEFTKVSGDFIKVRDAQQRIEASAQDPSAAGDLALIFNYMKVLDPGSTVREGEFANAENSAGIPARLRAKYNKVVSGERLADEQRQDFVARSRKLFAAQEASHNRDRQNFDALAKRNGLNSDNVLLDFSISGQPQQSEDVAQARAILGL